MRGRCQNPKNDRYKYYGGRGIKVCERWQVFENFFEDMGERPTPKHSVERLDNDGDYEPGNCVWATIEEQRSNMRCNVLITYKGKTQTATRWARELGLDPRLILRRIRSGRKEPKELFEKKNLKWKYLTYLGRTQSMLEWSQELGIKYSTLRSRLQDGWSVERACASS